MSIPPPLYQQAAKTSLAAIWSLICGVLVFFCLGIIAGIPAVVLGHIALSAINKSHGALKGSGMAIAGLVMGYFSILFTPILLALAIPNFVLARQKAQLTLATNECRSIESAVLQYEMEYGKLPAPGVAERSRVAGDETFAANNQLLFNILRAIPAAGSDSPDAQNPRKVVFFEGRTAKGTPPKNGFGSDGVLYDYWGRPYMIRLDYDGDGEVSNPYELFSRPIQKKVIVWSLGPDGQPGKNGYPSPSYDPHSWEHGSKNPD